MILLIGLIISGIPVPAQTVTMTVNGGGIEHSYRNKSSNSEIMAAFGVWREDSARPVDKSAYEVKPGIWKEGMGGEIFWFGTDHDSVPEHFSCKRTIRVTDDDTKGYSITGGGLEMCCDSPRSCIVDSIGCVPATEKAVISDIQDNSDREVRYRIYFRIVD